MKIVWDESKRMANLAKHGLDFATVTFEIFDANTVQTSKNGRLKAIGYIDGTPVAMDFKPLGTEAISVISLRHASKSERRLLW